MEDHMPRNIVRCIGVVATLTILAATGAGAQTFDKRTYFTFNTPVSIPGVTLPPGKYLFRLADAQSRDVVQVLSPDGRTPYATFFAIPDQRAQAPRDPEVQFLETAEGMPAAIKTWWYPGSRTGYEFLYPKQQARLLARGTGQPVLTTAPETVSAAETRTVELTRVLPSGDEKPLVINPPEERIVALEPVREPALVGEIAAAEPPVSEQVPARTALPKTAGTTGADLLAAVLLIAIAGMIRTVRMVRG
jgi:hypothetical protein